MRKNELILDKFSQPQNHPLVIAKMVYEMIHKETHVNEVIKKISKKRKNKFNAIDEARIIKSIGLLIGLGMVSYYKGFIRQTCN